MRMFSEPESWLGLRSERVVAADFGGPTALRSAPPRRTPDGAPLSWPEVGKVVRRAIGMILGR